MLPVLIAVLGGIVQFGVVFWAQNTLTQVTRDTGRWAATQQSVCSSPSSWGTAQSNVLAQANSIAESSSLVGYTSGEWATVSTYPASPQPREGVEVAWADETPPIPPATTPPSTDACPPPNNQQVWYVTIRIDHVVPVFLPGMQYLPGMSTCTGQGGINGPCIFLSSTAEFRMEPAPLALTDPPRTGRIG